MKNILTTLLILFVVQLIAQTNQTADLPTISVTKNSIHFVSPEPVQYVDISSPHFAGDMPVNNMVRLKYHPDTAGNQEPGKSAIVTIVAQSYYAQYNVVFDDRPIQAVTSVEVLPEHMRALEFPEITMNRIEMKYFASEVIKRKRSFYNVAAKTTGMLAYLNNIYSMGDYVFVDITFENRTNIKYDMDDLRFHIKDKRIVKATNIQDIEIKPELILNEQPYFKKKHRNVYVFKKFTFPNDKVLSVQLNEKQISGRTIELNIDYRDLLNADTL